VITCQKCGKENQDHYKFCLGCGAELTREAAPKPVGRAPAVAAEATHGLSDRGLSDRGLSDRGLSDRGLSDRSLADRGFSDRGVEAQVEPSVTPPLGPDSTHASLGIQVPRARPVEPAAGHPVPVSSNGASAHINCPQCEHQNPATNRFCASCGYKLNLSSVPAKPGVAPAAAVSGAIMLTALRADGSEAGSYTLTQSPTETIGRDTGSIFAGDSYLSPRHATFTRKSERLFVSDARSLNGVYLKIRPNAPWPLRFGDVFRIGQEILRLEKLEAPQPSPDGVQRLGSPSDSYVARLGLVIGRDTTGNAFPVPKAGLHLGRERGDVLFPEDGYVSGLHCRLGVANDSSISLTDLGSSNGSFVRLRDEHQVTSGDILLMGQQLFRIDA
jgi:pSer/pThr/pTyr-binding forkhead associated (FHA) protein